MKDYLNRKLAIDDYVIMTMPRYSDICMGKIIAFTKQKVRVEYTNNWNFRDGSKEELLTDPYRLCRIPADDAVEYLLKKSS